MAKAGESIKGYDFNDCTGQIIGLAFGVHNELGSGFQEVVYQRALGMELAASGMEFGREQDINIYYKGKHIDTRRVDFVIEDCVVEIKARKEFLPEDYIQTLNYLKASGYRVALLINFGGERVQHKRFINEKGKYLAMPR